MPALIALLTALAPLLEQAAQMIAQHIKGQTVDPEQVKAALSSAQSAFSSALAQLDASHAAAVEAGDAALAAAAAKANADLPAPAPGGKL